MSAYTLYDPATHTPTSLVNTLLAPTPGLTIVPGSIQIIYGNGTVHGTSPRPTSSIAFYDGSLTTLGIGAGLLLTSGDAAPPTTNTSSSHSVALTPSGYDSDLNDAVHTAFSGAGNIKDATVLQFQFALENNASGNIQFDLVFGSDEYPEFVDSSFVDIAGVFVNGHNYAYFNGQSNQPLSILKTNLSLGNFQNNAGSALPIEYDGVSHKLTIIAPAISGTNTIKFAIADTGDQIYDSGLFIANLRSVGYSGAGLALQAEGGASADQLTGHDFNEVFEAGAGNDLIVPGLGDDVVIGGAGIDIAGFYGSLTSFKLTPNDAGFIEIEGAGKDVLEGVERLYFTDSGLFALDTLPGGNTWFVAALVNALTNSLPNAALLSQWVAAADQAGSFGALAQQVLDHYAAGLPNEALAAHLWQTVGGIAPTQEQIDLLAGMIGPGKDFATAGDLLAAVTQLDINTAEIASIVGALLPLDVNYFI